MTRKNDLQGAESLARKFHGKSPEVRTRITKPVVPDAMACIGEISVIQYVAERDGKTYEFRHAFKLNSRPHLCVSPDGKLCLMLGGAWTFTKDGFVDR